MNWKLLMITSLIFFPEKAFYDSPKNHGLIYEDVRIAVAPGVELHGWYLPTHPSPFPSPVRRKTDGSVLSRTGRGQGEGKEKGAILFLHGNAGNISGRVFKAKGWVERGYSVLLVDYRGYGQSSGEIKTGEDIVEDARAALKWLVLRCHSQMPPSQLMGPGPINLTGEDNNGARPHYCLNNIILYGESLGSYPAVRLAVENKAAALVLEAPFISFADLASIHYAWIPKILSQVLLKNFEFSNAKFIPKIQTPLFILHGTRDEVCPYFMSQKLIELAPSPKKLYTVEAASHNDLPVRAQDAYWDEPKKFVEHYLPAD